MTVMEFQKEIRRLEVVFPKHFQSHDRVRLLFERMKDLDQSWLQKLVDRLILSGDPSKFNFEEALRAERLRIKNLEFAEDVLKAQAAMEEKMTEFGLKDVLKSLGAKSLLDAVMLSKKASGECS